MFINDCILSNDEVPDVSPDSDYDDKEEEVDDNIYNKMFMNDCNYEVPYVSWDSDKEEEDVDDKEEEVNDNILLYFLKKQLFLYFLCEEEDL